MKQDKKFDEIVTSYINGNISWVREQAKKLSKEKRKALYHWTNANFHDTSLKDFFFSLI